MTAVTLLTPSVRLALAAAVFICALLQLALCIFRFSRRDKKLYIADCLLFAVLIACTSVLCIALPLGVPWAAVPATCALSAVYSLTGIIGEYRRVKNSITPVSVKQTLDNLGTGISFANAQGEIVLINYAMAEIMLAALGSYPRTKTELLSAYEGYQTEGDSLYKLPDGKIRHLSVSELTAPGLDGFVQITAEDVTELFESNALLAAENAQLKIANEKMQLMLERLADRIREQETLSLKTQIHNDIGTSLIALSKLIEDGSQNDVNYQLDVLQNAVGYFSNNRVAPSKGGVETAINKARNMGVSLIISGDYAPCEELLAAACDVCVTNCVNHARGTEVYVDISLKNGENTIVITNNGTPPAQPIQEGGGLSSLRRRVEDEGGRMTVNHTPEFIITIVTGVKND